MQVTMSVRVLVGCLLGVFALGLLLGDIGARMLGWDGPPTIQQAATIPAFASAAILMLESNRHRREKVIRVSRTDPSSD